MKKSEAIALLGGTVASAAKAMGITSSAVSQWKDDEPLPKVSEARVLAALWRKQQAGEAGKPRKAKAA